MAESWAWARTDRRPSTIIAEIDGGDSTARMLPQAVAQKPARLRKLENSGNG